jgi:hypothetical protein
MLVTPEIESLEGQDVGVHIYIYKSVAVRFSVVRVLCPRSHLSVQLLKMKLSYFFFWCLQALTLTSAAVIDNRDLASTILGEIESAASCAGCGVRLFNLP